MISTGPVIEPGVPELSPACGAVALPALEEFLPTLGALDHATRLALFEAGVEVLECRRVLLRGGLNVVGEVLRGHDAFVEMEHYPPDDVFDADSHAQYYYHAHRGAAEHGHFHTSLRAGGMPDGVAPAQAGTASEPWPEGEEAISHLVAVSMDAWGEPIGLFACNRWVTGESWYAAEDVIRMLERFEIDHAWPSWPANRWLGRCCGCTGPGSRGCCGIAMRWWPRGSARIRAPTCSRTARSRSPAICRFRCRR